MVLDVFDHHLPIGWEIYVQPHLNGLRPDFVLLNPDVGIGVFEVKDWNLDAMRYFVRCRVDDHPELWAERDGKPFSIERSNPIAAANRYKEDINDIYCPRLDGRHGLGAITAGVCQRRMKFRQLGRSKIPQFGRAVISRQGDRNSCLWAGDRGAGRKAAGVRAV